MRIITRACIALAIMASGTACSISDLVDAKLPPSTVPPEAMKTPEGAITIYNGSLWAFRRAFGGANGSYIRFSARMSDETMTGAYFEPVLPTLGVNTMPEIDSRSIEDDVNRPNWSALEGVYRDFNLARNTASEAITYITDYGPQIPRDLIGHMYAIKGYSILFLADLFCSGIPLTQFYREAGYNYQPGISTDSLYKVAIIKFDSALMYVPDSVRFKNLAKVGKGRALLNLGRFQEAAAAVADVPTSFVYQALYDEDYNGSFSNNWVWDVRITTNPEANFGTIGDRKGGNGLPYASSRDPRIPLIPYPGTGTNPYPDTRYKLPAWMMPKTSEWPGGLNTRRGKNGAFITVANGIAARLIEAEAAVNAGGGQFLSILNTLRTTGSYTRIRDTIIYEKYGPPSSTTAPVDTVHLVDTLWVAGTGGVVGLRPLTDPGNQDARRKLVYDERAYWLFLTGNRQGDMRRLVRVYNQPQTEVYPTGPFPFEPTRSYGDYTNIPVPPTERKVNPRYQGCINREA